MTVAAEQWKMALQGAHTASICAWHGLTQFRVLHRLHFSKVKLSKMFPEVDSTCDRCKVSPASLAQSFWPCPKLSTYWNSIFGTLSDVFKMVIEPDPMIAIFGVAGKNNKNLTGVKLNVTKCVTLLAQRLILLHWKSPQPLSWIQWPR